jgi:hypothetical protein
MATKRERSKRSGGDDRDRAKQPATPGQGDRNDDQVHEGNHGMRRVRGTNLSVKRSSQRHRPRQP